MSLLQMSFSGGVLILAVIVLRALALNRLPKGTFLALWAVAALRLLVPFAIPSPASVYTLAERVPVRESAETAVLASVDAPILAAPVGSTAPAAPDASAVDVWSLAWLAGMLACAGVFLLSYRCSHRTFRTARPVSEGWVPVWLARHRLRRPISVRQSGSVNLPLTYGVLRPVILLPEELEEDARLEWVLEHEFTHIQRFDSLFKLVLAATACVHWFNPLVWVMLALANRDMELRCDETVVRRLGLERRGDYARALISMEEQKSGLGPFASAFNKSSIEERIIAIMKTKKRSLSAILTAVVLVCCIGVGFATSASSDSTIPYPEARDGFTRQELDRLASLWFEGYEDMTVTEYQQKMWTAFDTPEDHTLIDRYANGGESSGSAFDNYFYLVFSPLTGDNWQERTFPGEAWAETRDGGSILLEYNFTMRILDPDALTVGDYRNCIFITKMTMERLAEANLVDAEYFAIATESSNPALKVTIADFSLNSDQPAEPASDPDAELLAQFSREVAAQWDETLAPYVPFGLTYQFDDPDYDGNGLTMWFEGKEVRGIYDGERQVWISEFAGLSNYGTGAVEVIAVYTDGVLSGLRLADPEEQAEFDDVRKYAPANLEPSEPRTVIEEREFPQATMADYAALRSLRTEDYWDLSLAEFNQRLLDWANENPNTWNRICCDVLWDDYPEELRDGVRQFASLTCTLSGTENGQMVRALYTGEPEQDPSFSENMPERTIEKDGVTTAWCDLYYEISYHIADKSAVTVGERNNCFMYMRQAVYLFWQNTDMDTLLQMTKEDVVEQFNIWAEGAGTENIRFNQITEDNIYFETYDERGID